MAPSLLRNELSFKTLQVTEAVEYFGQGTFLKLITGLSFGELVCLMLADFFFN